METRRRTRKRVLMFENGWQGLRMNGRVWKWMLTVSEGKGTKVVGGLCQKRAVVVGDER